MDGIFRTSREGNAYFCNTEEHVSDLNSVPADCRFLSQTVCSTTTERKCPCSAVPIDSLFGYSNVSKLRNSQKYLSSVSMVRQIDRMGAKIIPLHRPVTRFNFGHWVDKNSELLESQGHAFLPRSQVPVAIRVETTKMHKVLTTEFRHHQVNISSNLLKVVRQQKRTFFIFVTRTASTLLTFLIVSIISLNNRTR